VKQLLALGTVFVTLSLLTAISLGSGSAPTQSGLVPQVHKIHAENEVDCETCHGAVATAQTLAGLIPGHDTCGDCHDVDDDCGTCHVNADDPSGHGALAVQITFPHASHLGEAKDPCAACHQLQDSGMMSLPAHPECRSCHQTASGFQDCSQCHGEGDPIRPQSHTVQYMAMHALDASWDQQQCRSCHTQTDCQDCHNGDNVRPRVHELNYAFSHSLDARSFEFMCSTCHAEDDFCANCHAAEQVYPTNHSMADWIPSQHGIEARYNMESCIACHDAGESDPVCANCHGGN
jgi:hypothetical protein